MSKLANVISGLDFNLLHEQAEVVVETISRLQEDLDSAIDSNSEDLEDEIVYLQGKIDSLNGLTEFLDQLLIAAHESDLWVDPTRPEDLDDIN